jgi:hypothetical protein
MGIQLHRKSYFILLPYTQLSSYCVLVGERQKQNKLRERERENLLTASFPLMTGYGSRE